MSCICSPHFPFEDLDQDWLCIHWRQSHEKGIVNYGFLSQTKKRWRITLF